jgi:hypothetical protein
MRLRRLGIALLFRVLALELLVVKSGHGHSGTTFQELLRE